MKRFLKRSALVAFVVLASVSAPGAQVSGVALAALAAQGDPFSGFFGPWRLTATGIDIAYYVICYDTAERRKAANLVTAEIPDGSSLADIRTITTTAIVAECAAQGVTVPRTAVILPAVQLGQ